MTPPGPADSPSIRDISADESEVTPPAAAPDALPPPAAEAPAESAPPRKAAVLSAEALEARRAHQRALKAARGGPEGKAKPNGAPKVVRAEPAPAAPVRGPVLAAPPPPQPVPRPAEVAQPRGRHWAVLLSFVLLVVVPTAVVAWYLWERASPRYTSEVGFSVRTEEMGSAIDVLGGLANLAGGGSSSKDTDILYRYIQSREIVLALDARLDLRALWAKGDPDRDPIFAYHPPGTIEDLEAYWNRMVSVYNDTTTGLLDVQVQAFTPEDAQRVSQAIYEESQTLINKLSDIALTDTTHLARQELDEAVARLKSAREAMTRFRSTNQIVDPTADIQSQMGLLSSLQAQLAQQLIELDLLRESAPDSDPRVEQTLARVDVIQARIEQERAKFGLGSQDGAADTRDGPDSVLGTAPGNSGDYADLVAQYEGLAVDQEFAQRAYLAALASYDAALAKGRQQSRYLAAHIEPTLAERAEYPQHWATTALTALFAGLSWMVLTLAVYAFRDRR
ncbi:capsule biosynthesis protein [Rubellimicrobium arenae]|uniref:capsule biosynthesis protein n=1 Tax=Rubellimicrobium arenae TaxID=2817372 RepID=UPI001B304156|nr:capsule biosynthesis protein [Rubellimicrobium arenae]